MVSPVVWVLCLTAMLLVGLAVFGWRHRYSPGVTWFVALEATSALWVVLTVAGLLSSAGPLRVRLWGIGTGLGVFTVVLWFGFIIAYTGRRAWLTPRRFVPAVTPLVVGSILYVLAPTWPPLVESATQVQTPVGTVVDVSVGPVGAILAFLLYGTILAGFLLALETLFENESLFRGQVVAFVLGTLVTVLASAVRTFELGPSGFPITQVALGGQSLLWGYAVFRQQFLRQVPSVSRIGERRAFETLEDGVFVVDSHGVVLRANERATAVLDVEDPVGAQLEEVLATTGAPALADLPGEFCRDGRVYEVLASPVSDWRDQRIGHTVVVRDVTRLVTRQQRLEVLNRILRHNVRNDLTVIQGSAVEIGRLTDGRAADLAERIDERSSTLLSASEKGRDVEQLFDSSEDTWIDASDFVGELRAGPPQRYPWATVSTSVDVEGFRADRTALWLVVSELVENALAHGGEHPTVEVSVSRDDGEVSVVVSDDGPGIPPTELDPVRTGEESSLRHSSGLGLWLVNWGAQTLHADLSFEMDDGTTVSLSLPETPVSDRSTQVRQPE